MHARKIDKQLALSNMISVPMESAFELFKARTSSNLIESNGSRAVPPRLVQSIQSLLISPKSALPAVWHGASEHSKSTAECSLLTHIGGGNSVSWILNLTRPPTDVVVTVLISWNSYRFFLRRRTLIFLRFSIMPEPTRSKVFLGMCRLSINVL